MWKNREHFLVILTTLNDVFQDHLFLYFLLATTIYVYADNSIFVNMLVSFINIAWTPLWHDFANHVTFAPGHRNLHLCFLSVIINTDWAMSEHCFHWTTGRHCWVVGITVALLGNALLVSSATFSVAAIAKRYYTLFIHVFSFFELSHYMKWSWK